MNIGRDGCTDLQEWSSNKQYIVTKWYGSSLAIFEEAAFQKIISGDWIRISRLMVMDRV